MKIKLIGISKKFKENVVLDNVDVVFESGKIYGLIGRNGSGKSVFLKILCGFYKPNSGQVLYDDVDIFKKQIFLPNTRALIEKPCFIPDLTGYENLKLLADIQKKIGDKEILQALEIVRLIDDKDKLFSKYSLGMKQKLGIAQVIMEDPDVIILDEPFNGIENETSSYLRKFLKQKAKEGKIVILASHIKDDIDKCADYIYEFDAGKVRKVKKKNKKVED